MTVKLLFLLSCGLRILISAGEPSGYLFASLLVDALSQRAGCVGTSTERTGCLRVGQGTGRVGTSGRIEPSIRIEMARPGSAVEPAVGFLEGLAAVTKEKPRLRLVLEHIRLHKPDRVVLIGYSGFNLPLGVRCREEGITVVYLAPPQVWAWGERRARTLARAADKVICLFPFEEELLRRSGVPAVFTGYPLFDHLNQRRVECRMSNVVTQTSALALRTSHSAERIAFLPGSRPAELRYHLPLFRRVLLRLREARPELRGVIVPVHADDPLAGLAERYALISKSACAVVVSGTASLEAATLGTPQIVTYHLSLVSRLAARLLVRRRFFGLPNILLDEPVVPEILEPGTAQLCDAVLRLLADPDSRPKAMQIATRLREILGPPGVLDRIAGLALSGWPRSPALRVTEAARKSRVV